MGHSTSNTHGGSSCQNLKTKKSEDYRSSTRVSIWEETFYKGRTSTERNENNIGA